MSFPIRFKLTRKDTGESFDSWQWQYRGESLGLYPCICPDGDGFYIDHRDGYREWLDASEWDLAVAIEKEEGQWAYRKVGN